MIDFLNPLEAEEADEMCRAVASRVVRLGLTTPAIVMLEMHRPLANLASHTAIALSPVLAPALGIEGIGRFSRLLQTPDGIERLIRAIEEISDEKGRAS